MVDTTCPAYRQNCCFVTGVICDYNHKDNCSDYRNFVPKRPLTRKVIEGITINRLGNPLGAIETGLGELK